MPLPPVAHHSCSFQSNRRAEGEGNRKRGRDGWTLSDALFYCRMYHRPGTAGNK